MENRQETIINSLPVHLRPFVTVQDASYYSDRDHTAWRFLLRRLSAQMQRHAHPVYIEGLEKTGIRLDRIPSIDEMNVQLAKIGWRAVVVDGFVPPAIFMEFQALKVLPIALDMRTADHMLYTPAPDIVHESAGHAPFLIDIDYAEFLQRFGEVGMKAIATEQDNAVYEAIRHLSIVKECCCSTEAEITAAEQQLQAAIDANDNASEAALLSRLHWWTVEYGLVGEVDDYRIFGAGLLSSLGESEHCLDDDKVTKIPLTVDSVAKAYDITSEQPQLFVTKSCKHLCQVLEEFADSMCFKRGGLSSLQIAIAAATVNTAQYSSGIQVSGQICEALADAVGNEIYIRTTGPTQLAYRNTELYGHGRDYHAEGFGSPVGLLKDFSRCLSQYTIDELKAHDIVIGERTRLEFLSGITVTGVLREIRRLEHKNLIFSFDDCTVVDLHGRILFDPSWGTYDMVTGARITSVFGGAADLEHFPLYAKPASETTPQSAGDDELMALYGELNRYAGQELPQAVAESIYERLGADAGEEWLIRAEMLQNLGNNGSGLVEQLRSDLGRIRSRGGQVAEIIDLALAL